MSAKCLSLHFWCVTSGLILQKRKRIIIYVLWIISGDAIQCLCNDSQVNFTNIFLLLSWGMVWFVWSKAPFLRLLVCKNIWTVDCCHLYLFYVIGERISSFGKSTNSIGRRDWSMDFGNMCFHGGYISAWNISVSLWNESFGIQSWKSYSSNNWSLPFNFR